MSIPEPWLRGIRPDLNPVAEHLLRASEQIREDVAGALKDLPPDRIWAGPCGITSVGFHVKHLAGSTQRLCAYLEGRQLSEAELLEARKEGLGSDSAEALLAQVASAFDRYENLIRGLAPDRFGDVREVGRKRLRTTAISLAIHIAEHGLRHAGQAISAAKPARTTYA